MSRSARIELDWAGRRRTFRLTIGALEELQEATGCGPAEIFARLRAGTWRVADVRDTIRCGLLGAGLDRDTARALVDRLAVPPLAPHVPVAVSILGAALVGVDDERVGKEPAASPRAETTGVSGSPPSSAPAP